MEVFQQATAVAVVLGLLGVTLWWLRRRGFAGVAVGPQPGGRCLEALERLRLGPQHTLHLIRLGETVLLLASSPGGCALVGSFPCSETKAAREARPGWQEARP